MMEDERDEDIGDIAPPWSDGQCSRTAGFTTRSTPAALPAPAVTSFNISSIVQTKETTQRQVSGLVETKETSQRHSIPVGVVTARQRVVTTDMELVTTSTAQTPLVTPCSTTQTHPLLNALPPPPMLAHPHPLLPHQMPPPPPALAPPPPPPTSAYPPFLYPTYPDPHYYYFLQQQLMLLHHHQYLHSLSQQPPALTFPPQPQLLAAPNSNYLQSLENSVNKIKDIAPEPAVCSTDVPESKDEVPSHKPESVVSIEEQDDDKEDDNVTTDESFINIEEEEEEEVVDNTSDNKEAGASDAEQKIVDVETDKSIDKKIVQRVRFASLDCDERIICNAEHVTETEVSSGHRSLDRNMEQLDEDKNADEVEDTDAQEASDKDNMDINIKEEIKKKQMKLKFNREELSLRKVKKKIKMKRKVYRRKSTDADNDNVDTEDADENAKNGTEHNPEECEESEKNVGNILSNFKETFQKFRASYLATRTSSDGAKQSFAVSPNVCSKQTLVDAPKKIPTLENWTTIMQEKRKKLQEEVHFKSQEGPVEKILNNNHQVNTLKLEEENSVVDTEGCCSIKYERKIETEEVIVKREDVKKNEEDFTNNNEFVTSNEVGENQFKKKMKIKKKHKEEKTKFSEEIGKRKKKKKKEKKEHKERDDLKIKKRRTSIEEKHKKEKERRKDKKKDKKPKTERIIVKPLPAERPPPEPLGPPPSCVLTESQLQDGLKVLLRLGGHFYTSRLTEISPPDIYGVVVDKERGNKPHILSREEVLERAVS